MYILPRTLVLVAVMGAFVSCSPSLARPVLLHAVPGIMTF